MCEHTPHVSAKGLNCSGAIWGTDQFSSAAGKRCGSAAEATSASLEFKCRLCAPPAGGGTLIPALDVATTQRQHPDLQLLAVDHKDQIDGWNQAHHEVSYGL